MVSGYPIGKQKGRHKR